MDATEQIGTAVNTWTEAQKRLVDGWMGVLNNAVSLNAASPDPAEWLKKSADVFGKGSSDAGRELLDKLLSGQSAVRHATDFFLKAWKVVAPSIEAGKDWRGDFENFSKQWSEQMSASLDRGTGMMNDLTELTKSVGKDWPPVLLPWVAFITQSSTAGHLGEATLGGAANLTRLLAMESELFPFLSGLAEMPRAGLTREKNAKLLRYVDALIDARRTNLKFQTMMAQGMGKAVEATIDRLAQLKAKGDKITTVRDLMKLWFTSADGTLMHVFNSPEFLAIQDEMTTANNELRIHQRAVLEDVYAALDIPTRSEIDDAYKIIHDLKTEVRGLKKALAAATGTKVAAKGTSARSASARGKAKGG
ncbi:MAG: poly(R)-hydroxyalkanoic acid synthase subunit PhaE [Burkholderiales bacterium]